MTQDKHNLPWFYGIAYEPEKGSIPYDYKSPGNYDNAGIISANGDTVVGCDEYNLFNKEGVAELIIRAVNNHYHLVEALEKVLADWDAHLDWQGEDLTTIASARQALSNAKGGDDEAN